MQPRIWLYLLLAVSANAEENNSQNRPIKKPYIADAVGNTLPPPLEGPATVGSPSNLLTPDRYEFYTFDESGELVKRLMTLEEIQAIVAAGEGNDGHLVTLSNDDQPTIAFNFSQPPFTKVHSVVTNVQNVLKAQMEAQKNNPPSPTALDTPDVSESWSLILPSIFGNTGVDIVPDKTSNTFTTPETETIDVERSSLPPVVENTFSKEGSNQILSNTMSTTKPELETTPLTERITTRITTTKKPFSTTRKVKPSSTIATSPRTTTKNIPKTTTPAPRFTSTIKYKPATKKPTNYITIPIQKNNNGSTIKNVHTTKPNTVTTTEKISTIKFEKISTITTPSTNSVKVVTQKPISFKPSPTTTTTKKYTTTTSTTEAPKKDPPTPKPVPVTTYTPVHISQITHSVSTKNDKDENITTLTTQSVSPSTTVSTTQFMNIEIPNINQDSVDKIENRPATENINQLPELPELPIFDVAQSISQIASDLGNNFPNPTTTNLLESSKTSSLAIESKENFDTDIPIDTKEESTTIKVSTTKRGDDDNDIFVKVSTIDPSTKSNAEILNVQQTTIMPTVNILDEKIGTTIDPILSESMDDLLSQVVNQAPQTILSTTVNSDIEQTTTSTSKPIEENKVEQSTTTQKPKTTSQLTTFNTQKQDHNSSSIITSTSAPILLNNITENHSSKNVSDPVSDKYVKISDTDVNKVDETTTKNNNTKETVEKDITVNIRNNIDSPKENNIKVTNKTSDNSTFVSATSTTQTAIKQTQETTTPKLILEKITEPAIENKLQNDKKNPSVPYKTQTNHKYNTFSESIKKEDIKKKIQKVNIDDKEYISNIRNNSWKLISTVSPPKSNELLKDKLKTENHLNHNEYHKEIILDGSKENQGLEVTTKDLADDILQFTDLCNELAFRYWNTIIDHVDKKRSLVLSPYAITSMLAMMFMGARGATSGEMNDILKLDDMVTFNPHFTLKNISDSIIATPESGVAVSAFVRELYSDIDKGKILTFYKERAQHFYNGHVQEVNFKVINDIIRRRTNLLVKRYTWGKIGEYMKSNSISGQPPLVAFAANIFETDCSGSSVEGRDGEMYFVVSPNVRQRRLVPVPAVVYKKGFLAGYDPVLDATAAALGTTNSIVSTLFLMPGQQGNAVHAEDLDALEHRFLSTMPTTPTWNRLLRTLLPRIGLEIQIPRFLHKSTLNISSTLRHMGLKDLFNPESADLGGINGPSKDLYLSDMMQITSFATCGEGIIGEQHHIEEYPEPPEVSRRRRTSRWAAGWDEPRDYQRAFHDPHDVGEAMHLPLHLRPRQARLPARSAQPARLKFDRPFLYFVRHNPTGMILYVGRYNPRLLP